MRRILVAASLSVFAAFAGSFAAAQPLTESYFVARRACPATTAIRDAGNEVPARLEADRAYRLLEQNREPASHYLIEVPGASPNRRWVARDCGERVARVGDNPADNRAMPNASAGTAVSRQDRSTFNILAISWQPAFCEGLSNKPECRSQTAGRPDATRFSLHGLWPQPRSREYCGEASGLRALDKSATWKDLPEPRLSPPTRDRLAVAMPGTQSHLDRHEWVRHGLCLGNDAEAYFGGMLALLDAVNASPVAKLFADRVGRDVTAEEIRAAFDAGFGRGAGERVRISCRNDGARRLVDELTIGLVGAIPARPVLGDLMLAARPTKAGCPGGIVDAAGLQ